MVDLALAKAHLRAEGTAEDELIQSYLDAAAAHAEGATGKLLARLEVVQEFAAFPSGILAFLPLWWGPDPADLTIDYLDTDGAAQSLGTATGGVRVVRDRVYSPVAGWPALLELSPVVLTYTAGFDEDAGPGQPGAIPPDLVQAQLMLVAHWYVNREAVSAGAVPASEMPLAVEAILQRHRTVRI